MNHFLRKIQILALAFFLLFVCTTIGHAEKHHSLTPMLIDLKGWEAEKPDGMTMDMGSMKMINANRKYTMGKKEITAMLIIGNNAMTQSQMQGLKVESETDDVKVSINKIDGFQVHTNYEKKKNSGTVLVFLSQGKTEGAMFVISYEGLNEKEALELAKEFKWKEMKTGVEKLY